MTEPYEHRIMRAPTGEDREELAAVLRLLDCGPFQVAQAFATERPKPMVGIDYGFLFRDRHAPNGTIAFSREVRYTKGHEGGRLRFVREVELGLFQRLQRRRDEPYGKKL